MTISVSVKEKERYADIKGWLLSVPFTGTKGGRQSSEIELKRGDSKHQVTSLARIVLCLRSRKRSSASCRHSAKIPSFATAIAGTIRSGVLSSLLHACYPRRQTPGAQLKKACKTGWNQLNERLVEAAMFAPPMDRTYREGDQLEGTDKRSLLFPCHTNETCDDKRSDYRPLYPLMWKTSGRRIWYWLVQRCIQDYRQTTLWSSLQCHKYISCSNSHTVPKVCRCSQRHGKATADVKKIIAKRNKFVDEFWTDPLGRKADKGAGTLQYLQKFLKARNSVAQRRESEKKPSASCKTLHVIPATETSPAWHGAWKRSWLKACSPYLT